MVWIGIKTYGTASHLHGCLKHPATAAKWIKHDIAGLGE
jgi:hypothetical protein